MTDELQQWGPAMRALTEKQQRFVIAMLSQPFAPHAQWARAAGYSEVKGNHRVQAHYLVNDPRIEAAVAEVTRGHLNILGPVLATQGLIRIARNPKHPKHHWALEKLANRVGLHETTEHRVTVDHSDQTGTAMIERLRAAAERLGVDPAVLLGENAAQPMKLIEGVSRETEKRDDVRSGCAVDAEVVPRKPHVAVPNPQGDDRNV